MPQFKHPPSIELANKYFFAIMCMFVLLLTIFSPTPTALASIPDAIRHCQQLISLDVSINPLGSLCEGVTELRQLRKLILNDTQLEDLPPNIGK